MGVAIAKCACGRACILVRVDILSYCGQALSQYNFLLYSFVIIAILRCTLNVCVSLLDNFGHVAVIYFHCIGIFHAVAVWWVKFCTRVAYPRS